VELDQREQEFAGMRQEWEEQCARRERELCDLQTSAKDDARFAQELREVWENEKGKLEQERTELEKACVELEQTRAEIARQQDELERRQREAERTCVADGADAGVTNCLPDASPESASDASAEAVCEEPSESQSEGMRALERLRKMATCGEDDSEAPLDQHADEAQEPVDEQQADVFFPGETVAGHQPAEGSDDEVSIEAYMQQLLRRTRGTSETEGGSTLPLKLASAPSPGGASTGAVPDRDAANEAADKAGGKSSVEGDEKPVSLSPRAAAPEQPSNLRAMRELANESARSAITSSTRRQSLRAVRVKIGIATIAAFVSALTASMARHPLAPMAVSSLTCIAVAGWFGYDSFRCYRKWRAETKPVGPPAKSPAAERS